MIEAVPQKASKYSTPKPEHFPLNEYKGTVNEQEEEIRPKKYTGKPVIGKSKYPTPDNPSSSFVKKSFRGDEPIEQTAMKPKSDRLTKDDYGTKPSQYSSKKVITESRQEKLERLKKGRG